MLGGGHGPPPTASALLKHTTSLYHSDSYHTSNDTDVSQDAICLIGLLENVNNVCVRLRNLLLRLKPRQTSRYKYCTLEVTPRFLLMITCHLIVWSRFLAGKLIVSYSINFPYFVVFILNSPPLDSVLIQMN
jgi:hypothetical protein